MPKPTNGNIDILARRGTGKGTKISIWELKRPQTTAHAISQAYIYSVTLLKMLRTPQSGDIWYQDIIGFGRKVPVCMLSFRPGSDCSYDSFLTINYQRFPRTGRGAPKLSQNLVKYSATPRDCHWGNAYSLVPVGRQCSPPSVLLKIPWPVAT